MTDADFAAQSAILDVITTRFPDHAILSEERQPGVDWSASRLTWVIDPLDGTTNYAHQFPSFSVAVALVQDGELHIGVVHDPLRRVTFFAEKGQGAFAKYGRGRPRPLRASGSRDFGDALVGVDWARDPLLRQQVLEALGRVTPECRTVRAVGSAALFGELGIDASGLLGKAESLRREGQTVVLVAVDGQPAGLLGVADPIKDTTPEALRILKESGVRVVMLTGDSRTTAEAVARKLGVDEFEAEVLPQRKAEVVKRLQAEGRVVAMAGDGVNDAPALAQAQVGIAMGTGTDVAIESAGVTLVRGDLRGVARARTLSRSTMRNIRQNLFFAFVYNLLGVPLAAGVLYPFLGQGALLSPMIASAAMSFSSVSVIANSLRLRKTPL